MALRLRKTKFDFQPESVFPRLGDGKVLPGLTATKPFLSTENLAAVDPKMGDDLGRFERLPPDWP